MAEAGQNRLRHDSDALVKVGVLHSAIVFDCFPTMEDTHEKKVVATKIYLILRFYNL